MSLSSDGRAPRFYRATNDTICLVRPTNWHPWVTLVVLFRRTIMYVASCGPQNALNLQTYKRDDPSGSGH